jgi:cytochrome c-type biogenesis protein CcsB
MVWCTMGSVCFKIAIIFYFISTLGYITSLLTRKVPAAKASTWLLFLAFSFHTISTVFRWIEAGYSPVINIYESLFFIAWAVSGIYLVFQIKTKTSVLGAFVSPAVLVMAITASARLVEDTSVPDLLRGPWVSVHVVLTLTGGALFALACLAGIMYLVQDYLIKNKKSYGFSRFLPSLRELDRINHICLVAGFLLLTFGVIVGSIWARNVWGSHWQWDPKQVSTLISWVLYALLLHQRLAIGWKGRKVAFLSVIAFIILLFTIVGVNMFFVTVHNFT